MLKKISINNYAIIDHAELHFPDQLTIITGETGAGKSIIIGALSLVTGEKADKSILYDQSLKCIVEAEFYIASYRLEDFFEKHELDFFETAIIRREIHSNGRSRAFINDTPVKTGLLKDLCSHLIDIHGQHNVLDLNQSAYHLHVTDAFAKNKAALRTYNETYRLYKEKLRELTGLVEESQKAKTEHDYYSFLLNEFEEVTLKEGEQEILEQELSVLNNAEEIKKTLLLVYDLLSENDHSADGRLSSVCSQIRTIQQHHQKIGHILERIESCKIELQDISNEISDVEQSVQYEPERIEEINDRLDVIYKLQKKHHVSTIAELLEVESGLVDKLNNIRHLDDKVKTLEKELKNLQSDLEQKAKGLSDSRKEAIPHLEEQLNALLPQLGMPYALIKTEHSIISDNTDHFTSTGIDSIKFLYSPDKGKTYLDLNKAASGGELSRIMLGIKSIIASSITMPTLIFDEIDTGISGTVAAKVGGIIESLSQKHQLISITHLPQIASKGKLHYFVSKSLEGGKTVANIQQLDKTSRVEEIAKMLSGTETSEAALENAKVLLGI